jgi:hypothetical protein
VFARAPPPGRIGHPPDPRPLATAASQALAGAEVAKEYLSYTLIGQLSCGHYHVI